MIDHYVFYDRLDNHCKQCEFYMPGKCRKGHSMASPNGCPIQKFSPMPGHAYDPDLEPQEHLKPSCVQCVVDENMPDLTWVQVIGHFTSSMIRWAAAGVPLSTDEIHAERNGTCEVCPHRNGHWCRGCKCLLYLKAKVGTELCPDNRWKR